jgi:hypothetical protein
MNLAKFRKAQVSILWITVSAEKFTDKVLF